MLGVCMKQPPSVFYINCNDQIAVFGTRFQTHLQTIMYADLLIHLQYTQFVQ